MRRGSGGDSGPDFLCVKTYALEDVCQTLGSCVDDHTTIVPVMNGADTAQRVRSIWGKDLWWMQ
ncbi:MAG: ketopantoate reductase family protein [Sellimonas intestinalis]